MARTTARVEQGVLVLPTARGTAVPVGSPQWYAWLADEGNGSFFFANEAGSFTARKERRKRGGWYWIAYRSRGGRLAKAYIGRSEDLTPERLREITVLLNEQKANDGRTRFSSQPAPFTISARFTPPPLSVRPFGMIERTELLQRLDAGLHRKLTLVAAPAGFGKTTLLTRWYETRCRQRGAEHAMAWITLDERDNDPVRFWSLIWSALRHGQQDGDANFSTPLYSTPQMSIEAVLAAVLSSRRRCILILDDHHAITNAQIHEQMEWLLTYLPSSMHIIIASRSEPPLSLGRARMYGELHELRADDLRLRREEIERFLNESVGITLSAEEQALLEQRTEGWIAGLHLVALALRAQRRPGEVLRQFTGSQRSLFDYFAEEVFAQQPEEVQRFVLSTAVLTEFTPQLCAAMLDDSVTDSSAARARSLLDHLERANVFLIPLDEQRRRYRYHALFSEFLQEKLKQSAPELIAHLHRRAARWYEQQNMEEEALEQALAGHDLERACRPH